MEAFTPARLNTITSRGRILWLRVPLTVLVSVEYHQPWWICEHKELNIIGCGYSRQEALQALMDDFLACYDGLVGEKDGSLTLDARELRDRFVDLVECSQTEEQRELPLVEGERRRLL